MEITVVRLEVDCIIIGQGICGTMLSFELIKREKSFLVIDGGSSNSASRVAAGLINPVTGKRHVPSWRYDEFLPVALEMYSEIETLLGRSLLHKTRLVQLHISPSEREAFETKLCLNPHLSVIKHPDDLSYFGNFSGAGCIEPCFIVNTQLLLDGWRAHLKEQQLLSEERFQWEDVKLVDGFVSYKGIRAKKLFCCEGGAAADNPYFKMLPFSFNKGQVLVTEIPGMGQDQIVQKHFKFIPLGNSLFWIGSSFEWKYQNAEPTGDFLHAASNYLQEHLKLPFAVKQHLASLRPASVDYRPFVGFHPVFPALGILNGMGSKGFLQAPWFARQIAAHLYHQTPILPEADVLRFEKILSRFPYTS